MSQEAKRPVGAAILYWTGCIGLIEILHLAGVITTPEALQLSTLIVALTLLRICEVKLISDEKIVSSIVVYYAAPPLLCSAFYLVAASSGGGRAAAAAAQSIAYCVAALAALHTAKGVGLLMVRALRSPALFVAREFADSKSLMISGAAVATADSLPVVLLRSLDAFAVIPVYEIARKIASVPTTLVSPLLNRLNPRMIRAYASRNKPEIHRLLGSMNRPLCYTGIVFALCVAATLIASPYDRRVHDVAELLLPLSLGTVAAMWCLPYQSLLIAAHGDHWFAISSGVAVVLLLTLTHLFSALGPGLAVAYAVGLSVATSRLIIRYRAIKEA